MMELSLATKSKEISLIGVDGEKQKIFAREFTVGDTLFLSTIQQPIFDSALDDLAMYSKLALCRLVTTMKKEDGSYMWDQETILDVPDAVLAQLMLVTMEINPLPSQTETLDSKKK